MFRLKIKKSASALNLLCISTFLYLSRNPLLKLAEFLSIKSIALILIWGLCILTFGLYTLISNNVCIDGILLILANMLFFSITLLMHPEYQDRFDDIYHLGTYSAQSVFSLGAAIYCYYIFRLFENKEDEIYKVMKAVAFCTLLFEFLGLFISSNEKFIQNNYSMGIGYDYELAAMIFLVQFFYEKKAFMSLVFSIICEGLALLYGSRGSLVGFTVFLLVYYIWARKINYKNLFIFFLGIIIAIVISSPDIMYILYRMLESKGIYSRTIYRFVVSGDVANETGRTKYIWPVLVEKLKSLNFFEMMGAYGDRSLIPTTQPYAHNFVLEILLTFGKALGSVILLWILISFFFVIIKDRSIGGLLTLAFICFALCRLFFSSSFWIETYFWAFIAMFVNESKKTNQFTSDLGQFTGLL